MRPGRFTMEKARNRFWDGENRCVRMDLWAWVLLAVLLALECAATGLSQSPGGNVQPGQSNSNVIPFQSHQSPSTMPVGNLDPLMAERRLRALNIERQKRMVADAGKLLKLARELNEEVARANTGRLTPAELHKIAEIEKLARSVRQKMVNGVAESTPILPPTVGFPNQ